MSTAPTAQELAEFRRDVHGWLKADNAPADPGFLLPMTFMEVGLMPSSNSSGSGSTSYGALVICMAWPKAYGGGQGMDPASPMTRMWRCGAWCSSPSTSSASAKGP